MAEAVRGRRDRGDLAANATEERLRAELGDAEFAALRDAGAAVPRDEVLSGLGADLTSVWRPVPLPAASEPPARGDQTRRR
jgi:hypothetical protein